MSTALPAGPPWGSGTLAELMPAVAAALGVPLTDADRAAPTWSLPRSRAVCVFLVDGLGEVGLRARTGHAPGMRGLLDSAAAGAPATLIAGFPTTTAVSLASLGTGLPPAGHGMIGTEVLDPDRGVLVHQLRWDPELDPRRWQRHRTVFEHLQAAGARAFHVAPGVFDGSGLTVAALRGLDFQAAATLSARVDLAARLLRTAGRTAPGRPAAPVFVLLYWEGLDKVGHVHGWESTQWTEELERVDAAVRQLVEESPVDAEIYVTGDHGMVDVEPADRLDLADTARFPGLLDGVARLGGEPRIRFAYTRPGAEADVHSAFTEQLSATSWIATREQALELGWFGPALDAQVLPRLPAVLAATREPVALVDSVNQRAESLALLGLHGSFSDGELFVPLLHTTGQARASRR